MVLHAVAPSTPQLIAAAVRVLQPHISARRLLKVQRLLRARVRDTTVVLESMSDPGNVSACIRTCDALGLSHIHVVENGEPFVPAKGIDRGAMRWLQIQHHASSWQCVQSLRREGFAVFATDLGHGAVDMRTAVAQSLTMKPKPPHPSSAAADGAAEAQPSALPPLAATTAATATTAARATRPRVAIVFGHEHRGVSRAMASAADARFFYPTRGFVQSLNVSVAAALVTAAFLERTPDYADESLRVHVMRESMQQQFGLVRTSAGDTQSTVLERLEKRRKEAREAAAAAIAGLGAAADTPAEQEQEQEPTALLDTTDAPDSALPQYCEGLSDDEYNSMLLRYLLADVVGADKLLEKANLRPPEW
jgi:tRNA (guanosine-2'-O-)-methyltransferase